MLLRAQAAFHALPASYQLQKPRPLPRGPQSTKRIGLGLKSLQSGHQPRQHRGRTGRTGNRGLLIQKVSSIGDASCRGPCGPLHDLSKQIWSVRHRASSPCSAVPASAVSHSASRARSLFRRSRPRAHSPPRSRSQTPLATDCVRASWDQSEEVDAWRPHPQLDLFSPASSGGAYPDPRTVGRVVSVSGARADGALSVEDVRPD